MRRMAALLVIGLSVLGVLSCKHKSSVSTTDKIKVVVTIPPLADFVHEVGGEGVQVTNLLPPGASPHTFEPTPSQARAASEADLVIRIGLDADHWIDGLLPSNVPVITAAELDGIELIYEGQSHEHEVERREGANPHVWLDPVYAKVISSAIASKLAKLDPAGKAEYEKNLSGYLAELDSLDAEIRTAVKGFGSKAYVSFHPAWVYFARRYGLQRVAVIAESPGKEPTPRHLAEVIEAVRKSGAKAVFAEPQLSPKAARVIAREAGVEVLFLDPLGRQKESYVEMMTRNLEALSEAMGDK